MSKWVSVKDGTPEQSDSYDCSTIKVPVIYLTKMGYRDISIAWADVQDGDTLWFCAAQDSDRVLFWLDGVPDWTNLGNF